MTGLPDLAGGGTPVSPVSPATGVGAVASADLYWQLTRFYARQVRLLGEQDIEGWARTFAVDAVFDQRARRDRTFAGGSPNVRRGRTQIAAAAVAAARKRADERSVRRYWQNMLTAEALADGTARAAYSAVLFQTPEGAPPGIFLSTRGIDELVPDGAGGWLVRGRTVIHDDLPRG